MKKNLILPIFLLIYNICLSSEKLSIDFTYPSLKGDFYVNGKVSFSPSSVISEDNITVNDFNSGEEIPTKITVLERWPDNSILEAEILFPANTNKQRKYVLTYGIDVKRKNKFSQTSVLPIINASIGKTPVSTESINIDVGELLVKVDRSPEVRYYWYIIPLLTLLFFTIFRTIKNSKKV
ncbi:MAG TPA: hypothetical protein PKV21_04555 [bacterium]|nr:hypothetical protein [bacterium]HOM26759.1 hypothetical protein [bacterium]